MTSAIFVAGSGKSRRLDILIDESSRADLLQHGCRYANIGNNRFSTPFSTRHEHMARLQTEKSNCEIGAKASPPGSASAAVKTGGYVHSDHRAAHSKNRRSPFLGKVTGEPCTKYGVDNELHSREVKPLLHGPRPAGGHDHGIAMPGRPAKAGKTNRPAPLPEIARCDISITTIIAGPAQNQGGPRRKPPHNRLRYRAAGIFHERERCGACSHSQRISAVHFVGCQKGLRHGPEG